MPPIERGVQVDLVLESQSNLGGGEGAEGFECHRVFIWPDENAPPERTPARQGRGSRQP